MKESFPQKINILSLVRSAQEKKKKKKGVHSKAEKSGMGNLGIKSSILFSFLTHLFL